MELDRGEEPALCVAPKTSLLPPPPPMPPPLPPLLPPPLFLLKCFLPLAPLSIISSGRGPTISTILLSWSYSLAPGKSGKPKNSSAATHPRDQTSIGGPYPAPSSTSGAR